MVAGFKKEQLRVQLDNYGKLSISGERPLNGNRWRRFRKEVPVPDNCNASEIRAKFENGILTITLPKLITEAEPVHVAPPPATQPAEPQEMPKPSEPEPDSAKPEGVVEEEKGKGSVGELTVGLKMKKRQMLINAAVAAVVMMGFAIYVAYKFRKMAEAETAGEQLGFEFDEF